VAHEFPAPAAAAVRWTFLSVTIIFFVTAMLRVPLLDIPLERDEGEYAYIAWRLGHHELPYRDWVDQKPPGIFWTYAAALKLPVDPIRSIHAMGLLWATASAVALFFLARRFLKQPWAAGAALLFGILSIDPYIEGTAANTELFMLLPLILSQLAFLAAAKSDRHRALLLTLAGLLTGIAVAFKQVAAVNWFLQLALWPIVAGKEKRLQSTFSFAGWSVAGITVVWAAIALYFFGRHGLGNLMENVFTHNLEYIHSLPWHTRLRACLDTLAVLARTEALVWVLALIGLVVMYVTGRIRELLFLAGWMVTSMAGVSASGYFFPHYFQQLLPVLCLTAALGAEALYDARFWKGVPAWSRAGTIGTLSAILPLIVIYPFLFIYTPVQAVKKIYPDNFFEAMPDLGEHLARITGPDDPVFIFGSEAELLFYARRVSATRYIFLFPLYGPYRNVQEKQIAAASEIVRNHPAAVAWLPNRLFFQPGTEQTFTVWAESYVRKDFRREACLYVSRNETATLIPATAGEEPSIPGEQILAATYVRAKP